MNNKWLTDIIAQTESKYPQEIFSETNKIYTCINPYKYHMVRDNLELYKKMDGIFIDGILMVWLYRICLRKKVTRLSFDMTAIAKDLFSYLNNTPEKSIYFIGSEQQYIKDSVDNFKKSYPSMNVKGFRNGYFTNDKDRLDSIQSIIRINPSFTIVGLGGNIQEQYAVDLKSAGYKGIVFTCGGFLHQSAQSLQYYPNWVNKYNLRALYRIVREKNFKRLHHFLTFGLYFPIDTISSIFTLKK